MGDQEGMFNYEPVFDVDLVKNSPLVPIIHRAITAEASCSGGSQAGILGVPRHQLSTAHSDNQVLTGKRQLCSVSIRHRLCCSRWETIAGV